MQSELDRRQAILEVLSNLGKKTISKLGISRSMLLKLMPMYECTTKLISEIDRIIHKKVKFLYCRSPPIRFFVNRTNRIGGFF